MIGKWLQQLLKKKSGSHKKGGSMQYLIIILAIGVVLMVFGNLFSSHSNKDKQPSLTASTQEKDQDDSTETLGSSQDSGPSSIVAYEHFYEKQLKEALEDAYGISDVTIKVNVTTSKKKIVEKDRKKDSETTTEKDKQGGSRKIEKDNEDEKSVTTNGGKGEKPFVIGTQEPEISGVVVTAGGADNAQVESWIIEATNSLLGVPEYRIAVIPKKKGEQ